MCLPGPDDFQHERCARYAKKNEEQLTVGHIAETSRSPKSYGRSGYGAGSANEHGEERGVRMHASNKLGNNH